ncbi:MAG: hypothetical protein ACRDYA_10125 [Egibacteraceae bacterium]
MIGVAGLVVSAVLIYVDLLPKDVRGFVSSGLVSSDLLDEFINVKNLLAKGLLSTGALLVIVLVAPLVYETGVGRFRGPLLTLTATASGAILAKLPPAITLGSTWTPRSRSTLIWGTWGCGSCWSWP